MTRGRGSRIARIQKLLCRTYGIEGAPSVDEFLHPIDGGDRESLVMRQTEDGLEIALHIPRAALSAKRVNLDQLCQIVEGVSHFLYVAERARCELPVTQLELELQAEVDKYLIVTDLLGAEFSRTRAARAHHRLYGRVRFAHAVGTELGDRYRLANELAARFARRLESRVSRGALEEARTTLLRFYRAGQTEKIQLARAA